MNKCKSFIMNNTVRIVSMAIVILFTLIMLFIGQRTTETNQMETSKETQDIIALQNATNNIHKKIKDIIEDETEYSNEYTGTIPPFTYIADIIEVDSDNRSLFGITSNKDTYSGLMRYDFTNTEIDLTSIELYSTYSIKCKPLIRDTYNNEKITPYVEVIDIERASKQDKQKLDASKKELSRYTEFKLSCNGKQLEEIVSESNEEYYKWSDEDILDYQSWIVSLGYTDSIEVVSNVKTLEQLKDNK